ncbi:hypothetical protein [Nocardia lasii]|uniref:Uncharacterized protein n=1 Tax=Nocardia lasii TaxID=1616107 RepID=A0ABW1JUV2_9NOCA
MLVARWVIRFSFRHVAAQGSTVFRPTACPRPIKAIALLVLTVTMNDRATRLLNVRDGFGGLDPEEGLAPALRSRFENGIECRGEVVSWTPLSETADNAPGRLHDLTGWECFHTSFHLEDFVPVDKTYADGPIIGLDGQRTLLRQGIALARELGHMATALSTPIPLRCIIATNETNGTFRFHRIRPDESWLNDDLDRYEADHLVVIDLLSAS